MAVIAECLQGIVQLSHLFRGCDVDGIFRFERLCPITGNEAELLDVVWEILQGKLDGLVKPETSRRVAAELARRNAITPQSLDIAAHKTKLAAVDPMGAYSTYLGGLTLHYLNWTAPAIAVFEEAVRLDARNAHAWNTLGVCHAARGTERLKRHEFDTGKPDLLRAAQCFNTAQQLDGELDRLRENISLVADQLSALERGVILTPQY